MPSLTNIILNHHKPHHHHHQPFYTFQKIPQNSTQITVLNATQIEVARFAISKKTITRLLPTPQHVCSFKRSSLSGTITLNFPGQEIQIKESFSGGKDIHVPNLGILKWRSGSDGYEELRDGGKLVLARGKMPGILHSKGSDVEVFVPGDELLLDLILGSWVSMIWGQEKETKGLESVSEVIGALAGS